MIFNIETKNIIESLIIHIKNETNKFHKQGNLKAKKRNKLRNWTKLSIGKNDFKDKKATIHRTLC